MGSFWSSKSSKVLGSAVSQFLLIGATVTDVSGLDVVDAPRSYELTDLPPNDSMGREYREGDVVLSGRIARPSRPLFDRPISFVANEYIFNISNDSDLHQVYFIEEKIKKIDLKFGPPTYGVVANKDIHYFCSPKEQKFQNTIKNSKFVSGKLCLVDLDGDSRFDQVMLRRTLIGIPIISFGPFEIEKIPFRIEKGSFDEDLTFESEIFSLNKNKIFIYTRIFSRGVYYHAPRLFYLDNKESYYTNFHKCSLNFRKPIRQNIKMTNLSLSINGYNEKNKTVLISATSNGVSGTILIPSEKWFPQGALDCTN